MRAWWLLGWLLTSLATAQVLPPDRGTVWDPGLPGGIPAVTTVHTTLDPAAYGHGRRDAAAAINAAIKAAGRVARADRPQAVYLPAGDYRLNESLALDQSYVVLRGAGPRLTRLRFVSTADDYALGVGRFWPEYGPAVNVVGSVPKGARSLTVADARGIQVGDVLQLDQLDDPSYVVRGDQIWTKRGPRETDVNGPSSPAGYRSVGQQVEVVSKSGRVLGLAGPTHIAFDERFAPQVFKTATTREGEPGTRYVGLEDLYLAGGRNSNIIVLNTAYGWIRNLESDGDPATGGVTGDHVTLLHAFRCEVRGSYFHHARAIETGGGAYGLSVSTQSSDNLLEDNIVRCLNKPIVMVASGGGNVIAYNYVDDAYIASHPTWQETALDGNHASFSHHDLFEGNWATNLGSDSTHGNCGWQTFFRNYAPGLNSSVRRSANIRAVGVDGYNREHNFLGNVLLQPGLLLGGIPPVLLSTGRDTLDAAAVYRLGSSSLGQGYEQFDDGTAARLTLRHGNFDYVTGQVLWDPAAANRALPASLYLRARPSFFVTDLWPFVDPLREPKVGALPARQRWLAGRPVA